MKNLRIKWKNSAKTNIEDAFKEIGTVLRSDCDQYDELQGVIADYNRKRKRERLQTVRQDDADIAFNQAFDALTLLINCIEKEHLRSEISKEQQHPTLHNHHQFTCNRIDQSDRFHQVLIDNKAKKTHFYSIVGIDLQSHEGIFNRFAYDLEGGLVDYLNPSLQSKVESLKIAITFDASRDLTIYKQNILKSLFTKLSVPPAEHEPILEKSLAYLFEKSPHKTALGAEDFVCVFLNISQWDWDSRITPLVTRWFINEFCAGELPKDTPTFFFFIGIVMDEDDEEMQQEIRTAIDNSELLEQLPELGMVQKRDIAKWLSKYNFVMPVSRDRKQKVKDIFSSENEKYMEDVEIELKKIIDKFNDGLMR